jgi:hypothetical protein
MTLQNGVLSITLFLVSFRKDVTQLSDFGVCCVLMAVLSLGMKQALEIHECIV